MKKTILAVIVVLSVLLVAVVASKVSAHRRATPTVYQELRVNIEKH